MATGNGSNICLNLIIFVNLTITCLGSAAIIYHILDEHYTVTANDGQQALFSLSKVSISEQLESIDDRLHSTESIAREILEILKGPGRKKSSKYDANSLENKFHFSQQEIENFEALLDKSNYTILPNLPVYSNNRQPFKYKHIIGLPYNFQLVIFMTKYDSQYDLYLQHIAGSFQAFFMIHASTYTPEYLKRMLSNVVKYGYRYPDAIYPGAQATSGFYVPNKNNFYVREQYGYQVDAHEFVHMLDFHMAPQKYRREGEQYVDGLANLLSGVCNKRLNAYKTIVELIRNVGDDKRYDYGPPLVAFLLSNKPLRVFHTKFAEERSKDVTDYRYLEKTFLDRFGSVYNPSRDYCRDFYDTLSYFSDFWSKDFQNHVYTNIQVINDYIA